MGRTLEQHSLQRGTLVDTEDTIVSRFERQVRVFPDKFALVTDEASLTYQALDVKATRVAAALATPYYFQSERPIALFMKDGAARVTAMLGALKANRICIPIAPNSPEKWLTQVIEASGTAQVIVDSSTRSVAERAAIDGVRVMAFDELARSLEPFVTDRIASADDAAFIAYTSGSTGRPKGVAGSHRSWILNCEARYDAFGLCSEDRYGNLRSSGVSAWIHNTLWPLISGGCLCSFDLYRRGLHELAPWLIAKQITYISFSGSLLRTWLASLPDDLKFPALRFVAATGERLYAEDVVRISRHLEGDWRVAHGYGSTETGVVAAQVFNPSRLPDDAGVVAAGRPVNGVEVYIRDDAGALVTPGNVGVIIVRSRFLAQGYWNNPELTAKVFKTDPHDKSITYETTDLGRWRDDGTLELVGRKGRRIRLRGYNIEPFQVESELMRLPGVTDAVVILHEGDEGQEPYLVGYVVAPAQTSPSALRQGLAERLPSYMVPSHIAVLGSFPIARSGKIDLKALPPPQPGSSREGVFRPPSNERERELCAIWQEVLKLPKIGIDDDFFELGGTSLQALRVFADIEARLGCSLSPTNIVHAPTIARLAEFIQASDGIDTSQLLIPLRRRGTGSPLFLVHNRYCFAMYYRHLLNDLKSDRPVYGLQPPPLDGQHQIPRAVESMATDYIAEIRRVQPHGPYFLAGHSFGGLVSYEIAQQLVRAGEQVSFLGLIDTRSPNRTYTDGAPGASAAKRVKVYDFLRKLRWARQAALKRWYYVLLELGRSVPHGGRPDCHDYLCRRARRNYAHDIYPGHITMFASIGNSDRQRAHWASLARGGLTVIELPAGHDDMVLPPHSKRLAEHFEGALQ